MKITASEEHLRCNRAVIYMDPSIRDSIQILLRVCPPDPSEKDFAPRVLDVNTADNAIILHTKPEPTIFTYDNVADADTTQEAVFSLAGKKIIEDCLNGYNGSILAYVIAHQQDHGSKKQFLCRCSFLEIYQEQIFDLLDTASQGIRLRENMNKGVFVDGLIEQVICNPRDAYQLIIKGWLNRRVALTSMNREGSRSHAVFTVKIESKDQRDRKLPTLTALGSKSPKIEDLNLSFKDYQKIFLQEDSFKKLYAVISKLQQENQNLLEKWIFMNHLEST
ncbi:kinesin protein KIF15 [Biomphalaria glabrata]|nr:kinesin protein KIF15 [Biomphalaria glabrata]